MLRSFYWNETDGCEIKQSDAAQDDLGVVMKFQVVIAPIATSSLWDFGSMEAHFYQECVTVVTFGGQMDIILC